MSVTEADLLGDGGNELVLYPSRLRSGKVSAVDPRSASVMWTSQTYVTAGMTMIVGSNAADRPGGNDILLSGVANTSHRKFLSGDDGQNQYGKHHPPLPLVKAPHPHKVLPRMTRSITFHR